MVPTTSRAEGAYIHNGNLGFGVLKFNCLSLESGKSSGSHAPSDPSIRGPGSLDQCSAVGSLEPWESIMF